MWNPYKKSKTQQTEENESIMTNEDLKSLRFKAFVEAEKIYGQIYYLFKEHINELYTSLNRRSENELKEGYNFILLQKEPIKICDDKELNRHLIYESLYGDCLIFNCLPALSFIYVNKLKGSDNVSLGNEKYYLYTIKISHDDEIELYYIRFKVHPSPQEINNCNEIINPNKSLNNVKIENKRNNIEMQKY